MTRSNELMAKLSGEKALGFVMLFLGSFVLVISITIGTWFGLGAMIIVGGAATASGALLRWKR